MNITPSPNLSISNPKNIYYIVLLIYINKVTILSYSFKYNLSKQIYNNQTIKSVYQTLPII